MDDLRYASELLEDGEEGEGGEGGGLVGLGVDHCALGVGDRLGHGVGRTQARGRREGASA